MSRRKKRTEVPQKYFDTRDQFTEFVETEKDWMYSRIVEAIKEAHSTDNMPFIIGGSEIYRQTMVVATRLYVSEIDLHLDVDAIAPDINSNEWVLEREEQSKYPFLTFKEYKKV
jgi:dihydrofolate reductase